MWRTLWASGAALALLGSAAQAADGQGRYNPHGVGRLPCQRFAEQCQKAPADCAKLTGAWIDGYISALNAQGEDTFDLYSWQDSILVAELVFSICRREPQLPVIDAVNEVVRQALIPGRIKTASERVRIGEGENAVLLYKESVRALQQRLVETGHLRGGVDGVFGPGTKAAVESFQRSAGLEPTGIPDQLTLGTLFYGRPRPQAGAAGQAPAQTPARPRAAQESRPAAPAPGGAPLDLNLVPRTQ